ncbi:hypothetical protein [uncultured Psychroserpens sp.]|nr:hypothetical protein [uncultured Psychroserpens sp.]
MKLIEYLTSKGGFMILALVVVAVFIYRKYKEKRHFKDIEKRLNNKDK